MQKTFLLLSIGSLTFFTGCASMFEAERDPASSYDRGYKETRNEDDSECVGRFCMSPGQKNLREQEDSESQDSEDAHTVPKKVDRVDAAISARDIVKGMSRNEVLQSWGEPTAREVAGMGDSGHERWHYRSRYSLQGERVLIFENGQVVGWYR